MTPMRCAERRGPVCTDYDRRRHSKPTMATKPLTGTHLYTVAVVCQAFHTGSFRAAQSCRRFVAGHRRRAEGDPGRLGGASPRPRRRHLHRPAGFVGGVAGGVPRGRRARAGAPAARGVLHRRRRRRGDPARGQREPGDRHRRDRGECDIADRAGGERAAAVPARRARRRGSTAEIPLPGSAPRRARLGNSVALQGQCRRTGGAGPPRLRRDRDAHADPLDTRGRARLPGSGAAAARLVLRAAAEPAAVQAAADGGRDGALLPDRAVLPRRRFPRRPPTRVHPARHGDELRRHRRRHRDLRGDHHRVCGR